MNEQNKEFEKLQAALLEADKRMKESNGHSFVQILKTRCQFCGRSPKIKTRCGQWFQTFIYHLKNIYLNHPQNERTN